MRRDRPRTGGREMRDKETGRETRAEGGCDEEGERKREGERLLSREHTLRCRTCRRTMPGIQAEGWAAN